MLLRLCTEASGLPVNTCIPAFVYAFMIEASRYSRESSHLRTTLVLEITPTTANHCQPLGHLGITRYSLDVHFFWREHWERCIGDYSCVNFDRNISKRLRYDRSKKITAFAETRLVFQNCSISSLVTALLATKFGSSKCRERGLSCRDIKR